MTTYPQQSSADFVLRSPDALVAAVPYLVGFHPSESAVLVWIEQRRVTLTQRLDLPSGPGDRAAWMEAMWGHRAADTADEVILVLVTARTDVERLRADVAIRASRSGVHLRDALRVDDTRWWSLLCENEACCPPEGRAIDQRTSDAVAAEFTVRGSAPLPDRDAVVASLAPDPVAVLGVRALLAARDNVPAQGSELEIWRDEHIAHILGVLRTGTGGTSAPVSAADRATVILGLRDVRVRDTVLWEMARRQPEPLRDALEILVRCVASAPAGTVAPVATCCSLVAWLCGDGVRATVAAQRALADESGYSLAQLMAASLGAGLPPTTWRDATASLSRDECRHGVGARERRGNRRRAS